MSKNDDIVMLAHEYVEDKHKSIVEGWWISEKYDGVCGLFKQSDQKMYSRKGGIYTLPAFITEQLVNVGIDLHGEIWFGYDTFDFCSGMSRKDDTSDEAWNQMTFMIFDTPDFKLEFEDRIKKIQQSLKGKILPNIKGVKFRKFDSSQTTITEELVKVENNGGEGLILRKPLSKYKIGRSHDMLKVKSWIFKEARVIGYNEGIGRLKGMVGSLRTENEEFGKFKVGSGLSDWQRKSLNDTERQDLKKTQSQGDKEQYQKLVAIALKEVGKKKYDAIENLNKYHASMPVIGDIITFRFKETTKDGNPKFPTFIGVRDYE